MRKRFFISISAAFFIIFPVYLAAFQLTSTAVATNEIIPDHYTCNGGNVSPPLQWSDLSAEVTAKMQTFALLFADINAPGGIFYHWILYNLPSNSSGLAENINQFPGYTRIGKNSWGLVRYSGPCPPEGSAHTYVFTLYVLDSILPLLPGADGDTVLAKMEGHVLDKAKLVVKYKR